MERTRYLEKLRGIMATPGAGEQTWQHGDKQLGRRETAAAYRKYLRLLDDPETKRLLFDSRQAALFDDLDEDVPSNIQHKLHMPFSQFYLELTEPVLVGEQEPGFEGRDYLRAVLIYPEAVQMVGYRDAEQVFVSGQIFGLTFFYETRRDGDSAGDAGGTSDRSCLFDLAQGLAFTRVRNLLAGSEPSTLPDNWTQDLEGYVPANIPLEDAPERHVGWWERAVHANGTLFSWMLTYMMAKSIVIQPEPMSRQQRRWHERKDVTPKPWHIVRVNPKFAVGTDQDGAVGTQHSYRYDVIGHLRFGKHKRGDGSYSETIEWIAPHQRGLANSVYIPKTYLVKRGKVIAPAMRRYYGQQAEKVEEMPISEKQLAEEKD